MRLNNKQYPIKKIELKEKGISTLLPRKIWFDDIVKKLNVDGRGELLGEFRPNDKLLIINQSGKLRTIIPELNSHFEDDMIVLEKWIPKKPISAIYFDGEKERYYVKRFVIEVENREELFISEHSGSNLEIVSTDYRPVAEVIFSKVKGIQKDPLTVDIEAFIAVKGLKAQGNQLTSDKVRQINMLEPLEYEVPEEVIPEELEVEGNISVSDEDINLEEEEKNTLSHDKIKKRSDWSVFHLYLFFEFF